MNLSSIKPCSLLQIFHYIKPNILGTNITPLTLYQEMGQMATLKCSHIALLSLLSLVVCSAHRTLPNEAGTNHDHIVHSLEDITDTHHALNGHVLSNGGGGGGGGSVVSFPTPTSGCAPVVGSGGGYGSGSGPGNDGGSSSGGRGGGGGWGGGVPSFGVPNFGIPGYGTPIGGNSGGYGFGGGYGSGSGGDNGYNPPGYEGQPWGMVPPGNEPYHCQPVNCGNPYGCAGITTYFSHHTNMNVPAFNMPEPESTGHAMAPTESKLS